jgi:hypothetical protein
MFLGWLFGEERPMQRAIRKGAHKRRIPKATCDFSVPHQGPTSGRLRGPRPPPDMKPHESHSIPTHKLSRWYLMLSNRSLVCLRVLPAKILVSVRLQYDRWAPPPISISARWAQEGETNTSCWLHDQLSSQTSRQLSFLFLIKKCRCKVKIVRLCWNFLDTRKCWSRNHI